MPGESVAQVGEETLYRGLTSEGDRYYTNLAESGLRPINRADQMTRPVPRVGPRRGDTLMASHAPVTSLNLPPQRQAAYAGPFDTQDRMPLQQVLNPMYGGGAAPTPAQKT